MTARGLTLFDTCIGRCAFRWGEHGIVGVVLPEATAARTRARLLRRCPGAREAPPPPPVLHAIAGIVSLLRGEASDLSAVALDMDRVPGFDRRVYEVIVPCHRVLAAGGKAGGFSANGGVTTKLRLLTIERARTSDAPTLFDGDSAFGFAVKPKARLSR